VKIETFDLSPDGRYLAYATSRRDPSCLGIVIRELASGHCAA
jgi:hypothetical protein